MDFPSLSVRAYSNTLAATPPVVSEAQILTPSLSPEFNAVDHNSRNTTDTRLLPQIHVYKSLDRE